MEPSEFKNVIRMICPDISPTLAPLILGICQAELDKLFTDHDQKVILKAQMRKRVGFYYEHPQDFFRGNQLFEFYSQCDVKQKQVPVYVMRFNKIKRLGNLRIFFFLCKQEMVLLLAFQEKKKADYLPAYEVAKTRLIDILKEESEQ